MYKKILAASALVLSFNLVQSNAFACHSSDHMKIKNLAKELGLTEEQKVKVKAIVIKAHEDLARPKAALKTLIVQSDEQFASNTMDSDKIDAIVKQEAPIMAEIVKIHLQERLDISKTLTDTQKAKFVEILVKKHEKKS